MPDFIKTTEEPSAYRHLEKMTVLEILTNINREDKTIADKVHEAIPQIEKLVQIIVEKVLAGGRLFYIGAGTSGRLAMVDASECPPTFGVPPGLVIALIAGGEKAITKAVEFAEDNMEQGWEDLQRHLVTEKDVVVGISASGTTPYILSALKQCNKNNIVTGSIVCNYGSPIAGESDYAIEIVTGPEFLTGSTRMKAGTAQKMVLNMMSTSLMILIGRVEDNKMVNMLLTNEKLIDRGVKMVMEHLNLTNYSEAKQILMSQGTVKKVLKK